MAGDNLQILDGAGTAASVSTDFVGVGSGSAHLQRLKIAMGSPDLYQTDLSLGAQTSASSISVVPSTTFTGRKVSASSVSVTLASDETSSSVLTTLGVPIGETASTVSVSASGGRFYDVLVTNTNSAASALQNWTVELKNAVGFPLWSGSIFATATMEFIPSMTNASAVVYGGVSSCLIAVPGLQYATSITLAASASTNTAPQFVTATWSR